MRHVYLSLTELFLIWFFCLHHEAHGNIRVKRQKADQSKCFHRRKPHLFEKYLGSISKPYLEIHRISTKSKDYMLERNINGFYAVISDPKRMIKVVEPGGEDGCSSNKRETVKK